jgi:glucosamine-6-phosphate deaminase
MNIVISETKQETGQKAAELGATALRKALSAQGKVNIIVATGASQFEMLEALVAQPDIDWSKVTVFHLDEYVGMPETHPASFRKYLRERFIDRLSTPPHAFHAINAEGSPQKECQRLNDLLGPLEVAVAFVGIGENGHLAFNDPPADVETTEPYLVVDLDEGCRRQQLGEGWFPTLEDVPKQAISMSINQILAAKEIICTVPDARKAPAVQRTIEGPVTPQVPASSLQKHPATTLFLDNSSASLLSAR